MNKKRSTKVSNAKLDIRPYLSPEKVFPHYPADQSQQQAELYSEYSKLYNEDDSKVSVLNKLMNIRDGLHKQSDVVKENYEVYYVDIKYFLSQSKLSDEKKKELLQKLDNYKSSYSFGEYNLKDYNHLASMIAEWVCSLDLISNEAQLEMVASFFKDLFTSLDTITRIGDHIRLLDIIIQDIIVSGYKYEIPNQITNEQKKRAKDSRGNDNWIARHKGFSFWSDVAYKANQLLQKEPETYKPRSEKHFLSNNLKTELAVQFDVGETTVDDNLKKYFKKNNRLFVPKNG